MTNADGHTVVMNRRGGEFAIVSNTGRERERFPVIYGAHILVKDGQAIEPGDLLATWTRSPRRSSRRSVER